MTPRPCPACLTSLGAAAFTALDTHARLGAAAPLSGVGAAVAAALTELGCPGVGHEVEVSAAVSGVAR